MIAAGVLGGASLALAATGFALGRAFSGPHYRGPPSDHFDGRRFHNLVDREEHGFGAFLRWKLEGKRGPWREPFAAEPGPPPPPRVSRGEVRVTFVGHATLLVQMDGLNVLTDPVWSDRASPVGFAGPRRVRPPGVRFEDLPPIDVVLVSHNHYDHLDLPTLERLAAAHHPRIFVGLGNGELLASRGIGGVSELDWWHRAELAPGVSVVSVPEQHFSGRGTADRNATLWTGWVVEGPAGRVYFAGDTAYGPHFAATRERLGPMRAALLPIGAYEPRWFMGAVHMSPAEAVQAALDLGARTAVAMHFGTFALGDDGEDQAPRDLRAALERDERLPASHFWLLGFGEGRAVP